jgi:hypothetical protein
MTRSVGGGAWCKCGRPPAIGSGLTTATAWARMQAPKVRSLLMAVLLCESVRSADTASAFVQPWDPISCPLLGKPLVCRPWCWQQDRSWTWLARRQHDVPAEDTQQAPPQQQSDVAEATPKQKGLTRPSGQRHAKWGTPASSVINAVNQMELVQAILPRQHIGLLFTFIILSC